MFTKGTPSRRIDLQLFSEEDFILPDDFSEPIEPTPTEPIEPSEPEPTEPTPTEPTEPEAPPMPKVKVKFNHEEKELTLEEAAILAQKGMNYDKVQSQLQQFQSDPRLSFVEEIAKEYGMTPDEYIQAVKADREQQKLNELVQQNIPEELAQEIISNRQFREQWEAQQKQQAEERKKDADLNEFLDVFKQNNGRAYDPDKDNLPDSVWEDVANGKSLADAYTRHENQQLKNRIKVLEQNMKNVQASPVAGVTSHGSNEPAPEDDFLAGFNSI